MLYIWLVGLLAIAALGVMHHLFLQHKKQMAISGSLNLVLFVILLPHDASDKETADKKDPKDAIAVMEQLYAAMTSLRKNSSMPFISEQPSFALEIALPAVGEETAFYAAVPHKWAQVFEKKINALYPHAKVEPVRDYNIFNHNGATAGSVLKLSRSALFPARTYRSLEADPLEVITNIFSKLKKEGEGAAIQLVLRPSGSDWQKKGQETARFMRKGKSASEAARGSNAWSSAAADVFNTLASGPNSEKDKQKQSQKPHEPFDEAFVKLIEEKASRVGFDVNIRLVASGPTRLDAEQELQGLEDVFLQFTEPQGNSFKPTRLEGSALEQFLYNFSFRIFDPKTAVYLSTDEISSIYHFPAGKMSAPKVKMLKAREASPPANLPTEGLSLGRNIFRGEESLIKLQRDDRRRHLYIIGQTGTGKSNFMKSMIAQDIQNGDGVCYIDPHGEDVQDILSIIPPERADDVIYFNPGDVERPLGLNMLEYDSRFPDQKTFVVNELFSIFQKLYGSVPESMGPMFEQYFRNSTLLVIDHPESGSTLLEVERVLADKAFRDFKLSKTNNVVVRTFWRDVAEKAGGEAALQNIVPYITSKFDIFLANEIMRPIIAQEKSAFNFREVMDQKKILLVNLSKGRLGDINSNLLGLILVGKMLMAALSRSDMPQEERNDFYLYIDEFQNVTTKSIATILSEARKYRLNLTIAHQFIGQLEEDIKKAVFGNVGSMSSFRIGVDDAEFMEAQFQPVFTANDLMNIDNYNAYVKILIRGQTSRAFNIQTLPAPRGSHEVGAAIKELSRLRYGRPQQDVEKEIQIRYS